MKILVTGSNGFIAKNLIQFLSEKSEIEVADLPDEIIDIHLHSSLIQNEVSEKPVYPEKINKNKIRDVLIKHQNDLNLAAKELNMSRTTLWRYRKKFNL